MKPTDAAIYERAYRLADQALWTIDLQRRRLNSIEPEDETFIFRKWSDFHFFVIALTRLHRAGELAAKIPNINERIRSALKGFDAALPHLKKMRDIAEHIDDYAVDTGKDKKINRMDLEIGTIEGEIWRWLGFDLDPSAAMSASIILFEEIKKSAPLLKERPVEPKLPANY